MNNLLQILGSIASIGSIPLAIYLYLRNREAHYNKIRKEILKTISFQIGEGRSLSTFEVKAVIDSKLRENRLKQNSITIIEIIEDLVSDTITNPMFQNEKKSEIINNLEKIHHDGNFINIIYKYNITDLTLLNALKKEVKLTPEDHQILVDQADKVATLSKEREERFDTKRIFKEKHKYIKNTYFGNKLLAIEKSFVDIKFPKILLLIELIAIAYIDSSIAKHILISLKLFTSESLIIFGKDISVSYPMIYGIFCTLSTSLFLHIFLKTEILRKYLWWRKFGDLIGLFLIFLLLTSVLLPDAAKEIYEFILRISWGMGIIMIVGIGSKIIGERKNYIDFFLPFTLILMIVIWIIFGIALLIEIIIVKIYKLLKIRRNS
jgi:hypothetical protein